MKIMATIGVFLFGLILLAGIYRITIEVINESRGIYNYASGYLRDLIMTLLIVVYAFIFSVVVLVKSKKK